MDKGQQDSAQATDHERLHCKRRNEAVQVKEDEMQGITSIPGRIGSRAMLPVVLPSKQLCMLVIKCLRSKSASKVASQIARKFGL